MLIARPVMTQLCEEPEDPSRSRSSSFHASVCGSGGRSLRNSCCGAWRTRLTQSLPSSGCSPTRFYLRLPSEALPAVAGKGDHQSSVFMEGDTIVLVLKRRKNKPGGSRLVRTCWCSESKVRFCAWLRMHVFVLHGCMSGNMSSAPAWRNVARE